jgi:hypothetical protein
MLQWATVLVVCPSLHELIHHDADDEHHDCAVTFFLAGQVEQSAIDLIKSSCGLQALRKIRMVSSMSATNMPTSNFELMTS